MLASFQYHIRFIMFACIMSATVRSVTKSFIAYTTLKRSIRIVWWSDFRSLFGRRWLILFVVFIVFPFQIVSISSRTFGSYPISARLINSFFDSLSFPVHFHRRRPWPFLIFIRKKTMNNVIFVSILQSILHFVEARVSHIGNKVNISHVRMRLGTSRKAVSLLTILTLLSSLLASFWADAPFDLGGDDPPLISGPLLINAPPLDSVALLLPPIAAALTADEVLECETTPPVAGAIAAAALPEVAGAPSKQEEWPLSKVDVIPFYN